MRRKVVQELEENVHCGKHVMNPGIFCTKINEFFIPVGFYFFSHGVPGIASRSAPGGFLLPAGHKAQIHCPSPSSLFLLGWCSPEKVNRVGSLSLADLVISHKFPRPMDKL